MDKKLLIISSSPHSAGTSNEVLKQIVAQIPKNVSIAEFNTYKYLPNPCHDCGFCADNDGCVFKDLDELFSAYEQADYVIFSTPVYNKSFPAPLKALIDRTQRYYNKRFKRGIKPTVEKPKSCGIVISSGTNDEDAYVHMVDVIDQMFTVMNGKLNARLIAKNTDANAVLPDQMMIKNFVVKLILSV